MHRQQAYGHAARVFGLAFHPIWGPNLIASASEDETVRVWCRAGVTDDWEQTSCCRGHQAEVLRVAWSPDGRILASGSADHTVRLWQVGTQGQFSYSGVELAVLRDHPGEVYGLKFLNLPTVVTVPGPVQPAAVAALEQQYSNGSTSSTPQIEHHQEPAVAGGVAMQQQQQQQQQQMVQYDTLLTASGESMYLWDLTTGKIIHQSAPLPVMSMLRKLQVSSSNSSSSNGPNQGSSVVNQSTGVGFAADALGSAQQQQQADEDPPSYIFSVAAADSTNWLSAVCSDGMLRLWDASKRSLQEIAAVKAHPSDMGSCCSFVPQQPWLILSLSKGGDAVLQDLRMLGQPLLQQQLEGPVYDMAWSVREVPAGVPDTAAAAAAAAAGGGSSVVGELVLQVVGRDDCVRSYGFNRAALTAGELPEPELLSMGGSYTGRLLALATTLDGRTLAAAGEAVPADQLKPWKPRKQQQQQQQQVQPQWQQQQQQQPQEQGRQQQQEVAVSSLSATSGSSNNTDADTVASAVTPAIAGAAAAAKRVSAAAGRRRRTKRAAVDLFDMAEGEGDQSPAAQPSSASQQQQEQHQQQQPATTGHATSTAAQAEDQQTAAAAAAAAADPDAAKAPQQGPSDPAAAADGGGGVAAAVDLAKYVDVVDAFAASVGVKVSDMPPEWAQMVAAAAAAGVLSGGPEPAAAGADACAAAAGVLLRAPLFTWRA